MSTCRVAVPVKLARLRVRIEKGRHWTAVDHLILWALAANPRTSQTIAGELGVPARLVNEIVLNLMRAGWVELAATPGGLAFRATDDGASAVRDFDSLPEVTRPVSRPLSFLIEPFQLRPYTLRDLHYYRRARVDEIAEERDVRRIAIESEDRWGLTATRLHDAADAILAEAGRGETLSSIDFQASQLGTEYALFAVTDGHVRGLPPAAPRELIAAVQRAAKEVTRGKSFRAKPTRLAIAGLSDETFAVPLLSQSDIITRGSDHLDFLHAVLRNARHNVVIHSTFLRADAFERIKVAFRGAAQRGAQIDILWGASKNDQNKEEALAEAIAIAKACQADLQLRGRVRVHMRSTRSHAKLLLADTGSLNSFLAVVGSCNWLSTSFNRLEMSVVVKHPAAVAALARELSELVFATYPASTIAGELTIVARALRSQPGPEGPGKLRIVCGNAHGDLLRTARDTAGKRILVGADRMGKAAEARALIPLIAAAARNVESTLFYSRRSRLTRGDERVLKREAEAARVSIKEIPNGELHGKFLLWDDDNIVISSLNWPSADTTTELPQGEIGIHVASPGIAAVVFDALKTAWPSLFNDRPSNSRSS
jgi:cardiolipin synthase